MTTKHSPLSKLKKQADFIAQVLKAAERGEKLDVMFAEKLLAARDKPNVKFSVAMDDKFLVIDMAWSSIRETSETALAQYVLKQMRETTDH